MRNLYLQLFFRFDLNFRKYKALEWHGSVIFVAANVLFPILVLYWHHPCVVSQYTQTHVPVTLKLWQELQIVGLKKDGQLNKWWNMFLGDHICSRNIWLLDRNEMVDIKEWNFFIRGWSSDKTFFLLDWLPVGILDRNIFHWDESFGKSILLLVWQMIELRSYLHYSEL